MADILKVLEFCMDHLVEIAILIFEFIGVGIIIFSGLHGFWLYLKRSPETKLTLAKGLAMGLEFKLGSEILRTVIVRDWKEIGTVAGIIALRAALTFLIPLGNQRRRKGNALSIKIKRAVIRWQKMPDGWRLFGSSNVIICGQVMPHVPLSGMLPEIHR